MKNRINIFVVDNPFTNDFKMTKEFIDDVVELMIENEFYEMINPFKQGIFINDLELYFEYEIKDKKKVKPIMKIRKRKDF